MDHHHEHQHPHPSGEGYKVVTLASGRVATVREGRGKDLINAQRAVGRQADSGALMQALVAALCTVEGKELVFEDVLEMPIADVLMLEGEVLGNFPAGQASSLSSSMPPASPDSSISASGWLKSPE
jgi:hypothetical protein